MEKLKDRGNKVIEKFQSLSGIPSDLLFKAFSRAFKDYELQLNHAELLRMLGRRGFNPALSYGAFRDKELVSFTFNGIGEFEGVKSAYDTGTGTIKKCRGLGLASRVFQYSIPYLKEAGVSQYILEVLQHNEAAISVYRKLGFEVSREFNYFTGEHKEVWSAIKKTNRDIHIRPIDLEYMEKMTLFQDFTPSWQNSFESISRSLDTFMIKGAFHSDNLVGYLVFEANSGDITQIAVDKKHRRKGIASALLKDGLQHNQHSGVKAINTEIDCESITGFLLSSGIALTGKQFEMRKYLKEFDENAL